MARLFRGVHRSSTLDINVGYEANTYLWQRDSVPSVRVSSGGGTLSIDGAEVTF
jgi:hypothetical protein